MTTSVCFDGRDLYVTTGGAHATNPSSAAASCAPRSTSRARPSPRRASERRLGKIGYRCGRQGRQTSARAEQQLGHELVEPFEAVAARRHRVEVVRAAAQRGDRVGGVAVG